MGITLPWKAQFFTIFYPKMGLVPEEGDTAVLSQVSLPQIPVFDFFFFLIDRRQLTLDRPAETFSGVSI